MTENMNVHEKWHAIGHTSIGYVKIIFRPAEMRSKGSKTFRSNLNEKNEYEKEISGNKATNSYNLYNNSP